MNIVNKNIIIFIILKYENNGYNRKNIQNRKITHRK